MRFWRAPVLKPELPNGPSSQRHTQLTGQVSGLSSIYERMVYTIRELQDDKAALQNRIEELGQGDPWVEVRRLCEENSTLRARLATAAKEKSEITWECDALLRKLNGIVDGPALRAQIVHDSFGRAASTLRRPRRRRRPAIPTRPPNPHSRTPLRRSPMGVIDPKIQRCGPSARPSSTHANNGRVVLGPSDAAHPPKSATVTALAKPVTTEVLVRNLELDEETVHSGYTLAVYHPDLHFLYDPILLESPEATYVVEWSEAKASQKSRAYITTAKEKHAELYTFMYAPRKAQHVAARSSDPESVSHGLERGELEQLTIELQQVLLIQPSTVESVAMKQLAQE
ncbi:hypothetical protein F5888DRAFT_1633075 [Russula emetica]|nr:hypothetical protein F5888DRAFT_1633075 [Russula emetica]